MRKEKTTKKQKEHLYYKMLRYLNARPLVKPTVNAARLLAQAPTGYRPLLFA